MSDKMPELLPCPFCGGEAMLTKSYATNGNFVVCSKCGTSINSAWPDDVKHGAIVQWNTRATPCAESRPTQPQAVGDAAQEDPMLFQVLNFIEYARSVEMRLFGEEAKDKALERDSIREMADELWQKLDAIKWGTKKTPSPVGDVGEALDDIANRIRVFKEQWSLYNGRMMVELEPIFKAALTAQSVNGQMLEALRKRAQNTLETAKILGLNNIETKAMLGETLMSAIAAEKAQGEE